MAATELQLGPRIRALRQARQVTLRELAERAGVTESFLSQVEREVTSPSIASVQRIARALDLGDRRAVRRGAAARAGRPAGGAAADRLSRACNAVDEFLTTGRDGRLQVIVTTLEPGGGTGEEAYIHESDEEVVIVLEGGLDLWVGDEHHVLERGRRDHLLVAPAPPQPESRPGPGRHPLLLDAAELLTALGPARVNARAAERRHRYNGRRCTS